MKLVLIHPYLQITGGGERLVLKIAQRYDPIIYTVAYEPDHTFPEFRNFDVREIEPNALDRAAHTLKLKRSPSASMFTFAGYKVRDDYDVINAHGVPSQICRLRNPHVLWYCHSPARPVYDLYDRYMRRASITEACKMWTIARCWRLMDRLAVPRIEKILVNSKNIQTRVTKYLHRESEVCYCGMDYGEYEHGEFQRYFFYPSRIHPFKRQDLVIKAFERFRRKHKGWRLVIAGGYHPPIVEDPAYLDKLNTLAKEAGNVDIRLNITDAELKRLYSNCSAVIFAPVDEDFGRIPLEGYASGKPCIAVAEGGCLETVVHGKTGYLFKGEDECAHYMAKLADDGNAEELGRAAEKWSMKTFTWERFFDCFDRGLKEVAKS